MFKRISRSLVFVLGLTLLLSIAVNAQSAHEAGSAAPEVGRPIDQPKSLPDPVVGDFVAGHTTKISLADNSLELVLPPDLVTKDLEVSIVPQPARGSGSGGKLLAVWDLTARDKAEHTRVTQFAAPVTLNATFDPDDLGGMMWQSITIVWYDPETQAWVPLETERDLANHRVSAKTDHFSIFGMSATSAFSLAGQVLDFQVNLNSGASTYRYPIQLPPGRGGFQPLDLSLNYNSVSVDEMKSKRDTGSWVGLGWSLDLPHIFFNDETDEYFLVLGGVSTRLRPDTGTQWFTEQDQGLRVDQIDTSGDISWEVRNPSGVLYTFDTERDYWAGPCTGSSVTYRWDLDSAQDPWGNTIEVDWNQYLLDHSEGSCQTVRSAYPNTIKAKDGASVLWSVDFEYRATTDTAYATSAYSGTGSKVRKDTPANITGYPEPYIVQNRILDAISIKEGTTNLARKYVFDTYTTASSLESSWYVAGEHTLTSITVEGTSGGSLPATTFTYTDLDQYFLDSGEENSVDPLENPFDHMRPYLSEIGNGFGASVTFAYQQAPLEPVNDTWTRQVVTETSVDPDPNSETDGVPIVTRYEYLDANTGEEGTPLYNYVDENSDDEITGDEIWGAEYRGFSLVKVLASDGSYTLNKSFTIGGVYQIEQLGFGTSTIQDGDADKLKGRIFDQEQYGPDGVRLSRSLSNWDWGWEVNEAKGIWEIEGFDTVNQIFNSTGTTEVGKSWSYFTYDAYGNIDSERHAGDFSTVDDDVTIHRDFLHNTTSTIWIVNQPKNERRYAGDYPTDPDDSPDTTVDNKIGEVRYQYDGLSYGSLPTKGNLTRVDVYSAPNVFSTTTNTYDTYGNLASTINPSNETTSFAYDSTLHAYLTTTTLPQIGTDAAMTFSTTYDTALDIVRGLKSTETDENGNDTDYEYDEFGRVSKVVRPGDTSANPTYRMSYLDWGTSGSQRVETEVRTSGTNYALRKEFFDGLGRQVQTQETSGTSGNSLILGTAWFDSQGRLAMQFTPWEVAGAPDRYQSPFEDASSGFTRLSPGAEANRNVGGADWASMSSLGASDNSHATNTGTGLTGGETDWRDGWDAGEIARVDDDDGDPVTDGNAWQLSVGDQENDVLKSLTVHNGRSDAWIYPDGSFSASSSTDWLRIYFQDFDIPTDADIEGIEARVTHGLVSSLTNATGHASLIKDGSLVGTEKQVGSTWSTTKTTSAVGSSTDLWGETWVPSDFESDDFGLGIYVENNSTGSTEALVHHMQVKVHYDEPSRSDFLQATDFGFDIPDGSLIEGIQVLVERSAETATYPIRDRSVSLLRNGDPAGEDKADLANDWPTADAIVSYGGSTDTWGRAWTSEEINKDDFGVELQVRTESIDDAQVDHIQISVYFTPPVAPATVTNYDALGRVTGLTGPDGATVTRSYTTSGSNGEFWVETVTDPEGNQVKNFTDAFGRLLKVEELNDSAQVYRRTSYVYDPSGNLTSVTVDPVIETGLADVVTEMTYDWLGRKLTHRDPDVGFWQYTYDANGNLETQTDGRGIEITFLYDELNRVTERRCTADCTEGTAPVTLATYSYDSVVSGNEGKNRLTSSATTSNAVKDDFEYDTRGRLTKQVRTIDSTVYTTTYTYDSADRLLTTTLPNNEVITQAYDDRSLPDTLSSSVKGSIVTSTTYNVLDLPTEIAFNNGVSNNVEYFGIEHQPGEPGSFGQIYRLDSLDGTVPIVDLRFNWDLNGNLAGRTDNLRFGAPTAQTFGYDFQNRLSFAHLPALTHPAPLAAHSYEFESLSSDTVVDSIGTADGTASPAAPNGPTLVTGKTGNGLSFDGNDDYGDMPISVLDTKENVTIATWFKTTDTGEQAFVSGANSGDADEFLIWLKSNTSLDFVSDGTTLSWTGLTSVSDGAWHHLAITRNQVDGEATLYLDGASQGTKSATYTAIDIDSGGLIVGQDQDSVGGGFSASQALNATLDDLQFFDRVLGATEIAVLADVSVGPRARWGFNETAGTSAGDASGSYNGTLVNGPTWESQPSVSVDWRLSGELADGATLTDTEPWFDRQDFDWVTFAGGTHLHGLTWHEDDIWGVTGSTVYQVNETTGTTVNSCTVSGTSDLTGITSDGTNLWVVDNATDKVYEISESCVQQSNFSVATQGTVPEGIAFDGTYLYVVDRTSNTSELNKYSTAGVSQSSQSLSNLNTYGQSAIGIVWDGSKFLISAFDNQTQPTFWTTTDGTDDELFFYYIEDEEKLNPLGLAYDSKKDTYYWGSVDSNSHEFDNAIFVATRDQLRESHFRMEQFGFSVFADDRGANDPVDWDAKVGSSSNGAGIVNSESVHGTHAGYTKAIAYNREASLEQIVTEVDDGETWSFGAQLKGTSWETIGLIVEFQNSSGGTISSASAWDTGATAWEQLKIENQTAPTNTTQAKIILLYDCRRSCIGDDIVYWDNVQAIQSSTIESFPTTSTNAVKNPSFEQLYKSTGTWKSSSIDLGSVTDVTSTEISWIEVASADSSILIETSINGGTNWSTATNGSSIPSIAVGDDLTGDSLLVRATYTPGADQSVSPELQSVTVNVTGTEGAGKFDGGLTFDGNDDRVDVSNAALDGLDDATVSLWFRTTDTGEQAFVSGANSTDADEFLIWLQSNTSLQFKADGVSVSWTGLTSVADDEWHHLAITRDAANDQATAYLDGRSLGSKSMVMATIDIDASGLVIGQDQDSVGGGFSSTQAFNGTLDELHFYARVLDAAEIALLAGVSEPVAWLEFNETSGTNASDSAGTADGTLTNGATWATAGKYEGALELDGDNDYVDLPHTVIDGLDDVSVSLWIKTTDTGEQALLSGARAADADEFLFWLKSNTSVEFISGGVTKTWTGLPSMSDNAWHHLALTRNATDDEATVYLDGVSLGTVAMTLGAIDVDTNGLVVGQDQDSVGGGFSATQAFDGTLDDLRVYSRILTSTEIAKIHATTEQLRNYTYDAHDNVTSKRGQGDYTYDVSAGAAPAQSSPRVDATSGGSDHYWPFNSDTITGDTVEDVTSSADGTLEPDAATGPAVVTGLFDDALDFDGTTDDYVDLPSSVLDNATDISFSFWFKAAGTEGTAAIISGARASEDDALYILLKEPTADKVEIEFQADGATSGVAIWKNLGDLYDDTWHQVVITRNATDDLVELFLDGESHGALAKTIGTLDVDTGGVVLGQDQDSVGGGFQSTEAFAGLLDDFRIYDRALNAAEATALFYTNGTPARSHLVTGTDTSGASAYAYDANGNTTERPGQDLIWNSDNRLEEIENSSTANTIESYKYDADGQRAVKTDASGTKTVYINGLYQVEDPGGVGEKKTVTYWHGGKVVATNHDGTLQYVHTDHLGSPVAATDVFGTVVGTAAYYPFGEQRASTGVFDTERGFTGQIRDSGTGLNFYNARYQDPVLGRFISPDSIVPDPRKPAHFNRFTYVDNRPLVLTDPTGHFSCVEWSDAACDSVGGPSVPIFPRWPRIEVPDIQLPKVKVDPVTSWPELVDRFQCNVFYCFGEDGDSGDADSSSGLIDDASSSTADPNGLPDPDDDDFIGPRTQADQLFRQLRSEAERITDAHGGRNNNIVVSGGAERAASLFDRLAINGGARVSTSTARDGSIVNVIRVHGQTIVYRTKTSRGFEPTIEIQSGQNYSKFIRFLP